MSGKSTDIPTLSAVLSATVPEIANFFFEPNSSPHSFHWSTFLCSCSLIYVLTLCVETCDGPNQYEGRINRSSYPFLFTATSYWYLEMALMFPILLDAFARSGFVIYILTISKYRHYFYEEVFRNSFRFGFFLADILSVIPFFLRLVYYEPLGTRAAWGLRTVFRLLDLLTTCRLLRALKDVPSIWAIRLALSNSMEHLVLPIFFFLVFNITTSAIFYFIEPCFNISTCPWQSLFDSCYYSVVTMTTTGYGNQIPVLEFGRCLACFSMIFGAIYMSFPLAIIGNEYEAAWTHVTKLVEERKAKQLEAEALFEFVRCKGKMPLSLPELADVVPEETAKSLPLTPVKINSIVPFDSDEESLTSKTVSPDTSSRVNRKVEKKIAKYSGVEYCGQVNTEIESILDSVVLTKATCISPSVLLSLCQLNSWLTSLSCGIKNAVCHLEKECHNRQRTDEVEDSYDDSMEYMSPAGPLNEKQKSSRSLSVFGASGNMSEANRHRVIAKAAQNRRLQQIKEQGYTTDDEKEEEVSSSRGSRRRHRSPSPAPTTDEPTATTATVRHQSSDQNRLSAVNLLSSLKGYVDSERKKAVLDKQLRWCEANPSSIRGKAWLMLERPGSSRTARLVQYLLIFLICLSILVLFTETLVAWTQYGETSSICQKVVYFYCSDKDSYGLDKGCFVKDDVNTKLRFFCSDDDCFGHGGNFGAINSTLSCTDDEFIFQQENSLVKHYGETNVFTTHLKAQKINPVCQRIECVDDTQIFNGNRFWIVAEVMMNSVFTIELLIRISVSWSLFEYLSDWSNWLDIFGVVPFYIDVALSAMSTGGLSNFTLSILASSPEPLILVALRAFKICRLYKLMRHFKASLVLYETGILAWKQLGAIILFLMFIVTLFAIVLYEFEGGTPCFVGDSDCLVPDDYLERVNLHDRLHIDKNGDVSVIPNVFYGFWFSLVTLTTTGYGDITPATNAGLIMTVFLMLFGAIYMAMPLTVSATTFYKVHEMYQKKKQQRIDDAVAQQEYDDAAGDVSSTVSQDDSDEIEKKKMHQRSLQIILIIARRNYSTVLIDTSTIDDETASTFIKFWIKECSLLACCFDKYKSGLDKFLSELQQPFTEERAEHDFRPEESMVPDVFDCLTKKDSPSLADWITITDDMQEAQDDRMLLADDIFHFPKHIADESLLDQYLFLVKQLSRTHKKSVKCILLFKEIFEFLEEWE